MVAKKTAKKAMISYNVLLISLLWMVLSGDDCGNFCWAINNDDAKLSHNKFSLLADSKSLLRATASVDNANSSKNSKDDLNDIRRFDTVLALTYSEMTEYGHTRENDPSVRNLQEGDSGTTAVGSSSSSLLTARTFPECIDLNLSPKECQEFIEAQIIEAGGHEVGDNVQVKIRTPRTPEEFADSYWMVEVPVNIYDDVACDRNEGLTNYPYKWKDGTTNEELDVMAQNCYGLTGVECCLNIRNYGRSLTETGYDNKGQCLSCFLHREPLIPIVNDITGDVDFLDYRNNDDGIISDNEDSKKCVQEQLTSEEVDALDDETAQRILEAIEAFNNIKDDDEELMSCDNFNALLEKLYGAASMIPPLSHKIGRLACSICYNSEYDLEWNDITVLQLVDDIISLLQSNIPPKKSSKDKCIVIHTSSNGEEVVQDPTFGNGRSDLISSSSTVDDVATHVPTAAPMDERPTNIRCDMDPSICKRGEHCDHYTVYCRDCRFYGGTIHDDSQEIELYYCARTWCIDKDEPCPNGQYCQPVYGKEAKDATGFGFFFECLPTTCLQDPTICDSETEWCQPHETNSNEGACVENRCVIDPPDDCHEEHLKCVPNSNESLGYYTCEEKNCNEYPNKCAENEYCRAIINNDDENDVVYECTVYQDVGSSCGFHKIDDGDDDDYYYFLKENLYSIYECDPSVSFCHDFTPCWRRLEVNHYDHERAEGRCVAYGEGSCSNENGELTQENCQSNEHCGDDPESRCKPNLLNDECCDPNLNECGNVEQDGLVDDNGNKLYWCSPIVSRFLFFRETINKDYSCHQRCDTDGDCKQDKEWCAPLDGLDSSSSKKFCKPYATHSEYCDVITPELREAAGDTFLLDRIYTEERCDPSKMQCVNDDFCYVEIQANVDAPYCTPLGKACTNDDDCTKSNQWCDVTVGYCKNKKVVGDCCTTYGDASASECYSPYSCQLVTDEVLRSLRISFLQLDMSFSDFLPGATVCA